MSLRTRIVLFIAILFTCAALPLSHLLGVGIACAAYLIIVLPALGGHS